MEQIHATNINGLGASQVVISFLDAYIENNNTNQTLIHLPIKGVLSSYSSNKVTIKRFKRRLPNAFSRLIECLFSRFFFKNVPTVVLGDIPLRGIKDQIVLVHQPNLIKPCVNSFSSRTLTFKVNRFLFKINQKYAKKIIVQTGAMAQEMIASYPCIKDKVIIAPQPVPNWLVKDKIYSRTSKNKLILFYPAAYYPHKKHEFLLDINKYIEKNRINSLNIEIWITLKEDEFLPFKEIKYIKNLGRLSSEQMNVKYRETDALLFLSSMESYGLPLVEALTLNLPIVVADFKYSRWLCEEFAYYFTPYDVSTFVSCVKELQKDLNKSKPINYKKALTKFPNSWNNVVEVFEESLKK